MYLFLYAFIYEILLLGLQLLLLATNSVPNVHLFIKTKIPNLCLHVVLAFEVILCNTITTRRGFQLPTCRRTQYHIPQTAIFCEMSLQIFSFLLCALCFMFACFCVFVLNLQFVTVDVSDFHCYMCVRNNSSKQFLVLYVLIINFYHNFG